MSYNKQNFQSGAVLMASQLNSMDDEISRLGTDLSEQKETLRDLENELEGINTLIGSGVIE